MQPAYRQAYAQLGNDADAQDVVQESLLQLVRSAAKYDKSRSLAPWLAAHVSKACTRFRRSAVRRKRREDIAMVDMAEHRRVAEQEAAQLVSTDDSDQQILVRAALDQLNDKDRSILSLHYFAGLSQADTGKALGISENTASVRLHRARGRMKKVLETQALRSGVTGVRLTAVAGLGLLPNLAAAAPAAPLTLLPSVVSICTAASLPSTLISLSIYQKGLLYMASQPLLTALSVAVLSISVCAGAVLIAADTESQNPPIVEIVEDTQQKQWNSAAAKLLAFHDSDALFQVGVDGDGLRTLLSQVRPFKQLLGGENNNFLKNWQEDIKRYQAWAKKGVDIGQMFMWGQIFRGAFVKMHMRDENGGSYVAALDLGAMSKSFSEAVLAKTKQMAPVGAYALYSAQNGRQMIAVEGDRFVVTDAFPEDSMRTVTYSKLKNDYQPDTKHLQQSPLWLSIVMRPVIEAYQPLSEATVAPIAALLGADWKILHPRADVQVQEKNGVLNIQGKISNLPTAAPWAAVLLVLNDMMNVDVGYLTPLRFQAPQALPAADADALLECRFSSDLPRRQSLIEKITKASAQFGIELLPAALNGEVLVRIHAGVPLPQPTLVLGLESCDGSLQKEFGEFFKAMQATPQKPTAGYLQAWTLATPMGMLQCAVAEDRLVLCSLMTDLNTLLEKSQDDDAALSVNIDVPRIAELYAPLVWGMIPQRSGLLTEYDYVGAKVLNAAFKQFTEPVGNQTSSKIPRKVARDWLSNDDDIYPYISAWMDTNKSDGQDTFFSIVYKLEKDVYGILQRRTGYSRINLDSEFYSLKEVQTKLQGAKYWGGSKIEDIRSHPRGSIPVFDRQRHIPSLPQIVAALPKYKLQWWQEKGENGKVGAQRFEESGVPVIAAVLAVAGGVLAQLDPRAEEQAINDLMQMAGLLETHKQRLAAINRIAVGMEMHGKQWLRPSSILGNAKSADLIALGLGATPNAAQIDSLGRWFAGSGSRYFESGLVQRVDIRTREQVEVYARILWAFPLDSEIWVYITEGGVGIKTSEPTQQGIAVDDMATPTEHKPVEQLDF